MAESGSNVVWMNQRRFAVGSFASLAGPGGYSQLSAGVHPIIRMIGSTSAKESWYAVLTATAISTQG